MAISRKSMTTAEIREQITKLQQIVVERQQIEENEKRSKKNEEHLKILEIKKNVHENEINFLNLMKIEWMQACDSQSIDTIKNLLKKIHAVPCYQIETKKEFAEIQSKEPREFLYYYGMSAAFKHDHLELFKFLWDDYKELLPQRYLFEISINDALFATTDKDRNALMCAIDFKSEKCALWLLNQGVDVNSSSLIKPKSSNEKELVEDTALSFAIKKNLIELAKQLILKGAWIGKDYTEKLKEWQEKGYHRGRGYGQYSYDTRGFKHSFDPVDTPFYLAVVKKNKELVSFFLERHASPLEKCGHGDKAVLDFAIDPDIKRLLLNSLPHSKRFQLLKIDQAIPTAFKCSRTGRFVNVPAKDTEGKVFCKEAILENCLISPEKNLSRQQIAEILELLSQPTNINLQQECRDFLEACEKEHDPVFKKTVKLRA